MKRIFYLAIAISPLAIICGCVTPQIWYQSGKTSAQAYQDLTDCKEKARAALDPHGVGGFMPLIAKPDLNGYVRDCMRARGWVATPANSVPC
jgi:hypothetical protein